MKEMMETGFERVEESDGSSSDSNFASLGREVPFDPDNARRLQAEARELHRPKISKEVRAEVLRQDERDLLRQPRDSLLANGQPVLCRKGDKYQIQYAGAMDLNTGCLTDIVTESFDNYFDARTRYRELSRELAIIDQLPTLEVQTPGCKVSFSQLKDFNPMPAVEDSPTEYPPMVQELLRDDKQGKRTYDLTIQQKNWQEELFRYVKNFVIKDEFMVEKICSESKVHDLSLRTLTPRQAIDVANNLVLRLTKYSYDTQGKPDGRRADQMTALEILLDGEKHGNDPAWGGNGVCRNFASVTKAVFEALKANQGKHSRLKNTHCVYRISMDAADYAPQRKQYTADEISYGVSFPQNEGHAWNEFVQVSEDGEVANMVAVDTTWSNRDLETREPIGLDRTMLRMQKPIREVMRNLPKTDESLAEVDKILQYYADLAKKYFIEARDALNRYERSSYQTADNAMAVFARQFLHVAGNWDIPKLRHRDKRKKFAFMKQLFANGIVEFNKDDCVKLINFDPDNDGYLNRLAETYVEQHSKVPPCTRDYYFKFDDAKFQDAVNRALRERL